MKSQDIQSLEVRVGLGELERALDYLLVHTLENPFTLEELEVVDIVIEKYIENAYNFAESKEAQDPALFHYVVNTENHVHQKTFMLHKNTNKVLVNAGYDSVIIEDYEDLMEIIDEISNRDNSEEITLSKYGKRTVWIQPSKAKEQVMEYHGLSEFSYDLDKIKEGLIECRDIKMYSLKAINYLHDLTKSY